MKLQFKHQKFQADAAKAVVDVFAGQPYLTPTYLMDRGSDTHQLTLEEMSFTGKYVGMIGESGAVSADDDWTAWIR